VKIKKWKHHPATCRPWGYPLKFERGDSNIHTVLKLPGWWNPTCVDTSCTTMYIVYIPTSSKGCCLNPKEWCIGTPHLYSAPFGKSRYIYVYMYIKINTQNYSMKYMQIYPMQATWLFTIKPSEFVFQTNILPYILYRWNRIIPTSEMTIPWIYPPGYNRHHQDDITFLVGNLKLNLYLPLKCLERGTTQTIPLGKLAYNS